MIKLTNASAGYENNVLYLNPSYMVAIFEKKDTENAENTKTQLYGGPQGSTWTVMESIDVVLGLINSQESVIESFAPFGLFNGEPIENEEEMVAAIKSAGVL